MGYLDEERVRSVWLRCYAVAMTLFSVEDLGEMVCIGLGLPQQTFRDAGQYGYVSGPFCTFTARYAEFTADSPHILAPTASDLVKYGQKDTILAGFHTDLNFLTIHGRSRYPGLNIWARNTGKRIPVKFPPTGRYLLVQAGKQIEHLSGGLIKAGYHEVVVNEATLQVRVHLAVIQAVPAESDQSSIRPFTTARPHFPSVP